MMGTVDYMAPEQATDFSGADPRADVYSLGCVCFHLLVGRPPFEGKLAERILKHQQTEPSAVTRLRPDLPQRTDAVLARMMAKRPEDRYQTAAEAAEAVAALEKSVRSSSGLRQPPRGRLAQAAARVAGWLTRSV
jgi:serine/threonine-protein kinase